MNNIIEIADFATNSFKGKALAEEQESVKRINFAVPFRVFKDSAQFSHGQRSQLLRICLEAINKEYKENKFVNFIPLLEGDLENVQKRLFGK